MRFFVLFVILLLIDWFSFQGVRFLMQNSDRHIRILIYSLFWMVPVLSLAFIMASTNGMTDNWPKIFKGLPWYIYRDFVFVQVLDGINGSDR